MAATQDYNAPHTSAQSHQDEDELFEHELYSPHFLAQDLNNEASRLITRGDNYPQAIRILTKALELSRWNTRNDDDDDMDESRTSRQPCSCKHCSLDACLHSRSEDDAPHTHLSGHQRKVDTRSQRPIQENSFTSSSNENEGFIICTPLRVSEVSIKESHYMGGTLSVLILFNLAISHQLLAISMPFLTETKKEFLDKALKLYEICIQAHESCGCSDTASLRLKVMVMNNLSEIHKMALSPSKHEICLDYLLRALMFIAHGREGGWVNDYELLTPEELDGIYRNIQSSNALMGKCIHAGAA